MKKISSLPHKLAHNRAVDPNPAHRFVPILFGPTIGQRIAGYCLELDHWYHRAEQTLIWFIGSTCFIEWALPAFLGHNVALATFAHFLGSWLHWPAMLVVIARLIRLAVLAVLSFNRLDRLP
jgi:hypothetical protein